MRTRPPASNPPARPQSVGPPSPAAIWLALGTVYLVWGSTYLAIRVVVDTMPPLLAMGVRFVLAAAILAAALAVRLGWKALRVTRREVVATALVGGLLLLGGNGGVAVAEKTVPSGLAALLVAAVPLWLVLLRTVAGDRPRTVTVVGTLVGFVGIATLALPGSRGDEVEAWGVLLVLGATVSWALGSFLSSRVPLPSDPFVATAWEMLCGGVLLLVVATIGGDLADFSPADVASSAWLALGYLVLVGSIAGYSAYVWLLHRAPISLTATYAYVNPVVAVILGAVLLDEAITGAILAGGLVVVVGVGLVVSAERPRSRASATGELTPPPDPEVALVER